MSTTKNVYVNSSNFSANAGKAFSQLWERRDFSDVTLVSGDKRQVKAHRIVLSSSSNFFRDILSTNSHHPNPLLYLKDILHEHLDVLLKFIYKGEVEVKTEMLEQFLDLGRLLQVEGLVQDQEVQDEQTVIKKDKKGIKKEMSLQQNNSNPKDTSVLVNSDEDVVLQNQPMANHPTNLMSCNFCSDEFSERRLLKVHYLNNHEITSYQCDRCKYKASLHKNLNLHKQTKHEGVKHLCGQCGFKGIDDSDLEKHIRFYHKDKTE